MKLILAIYCLMFSFNSLSMDEPPVDLPFAERLPPDSWTQLFEFMSWKDRQILRVCCQSAKSLVDEHYPTLEKKPGRAFCGPKNQHLQYCCTQKNFCVVLKGYQLTMFNSKTGESKSSQLPCTINIFSFGSHATGMYFLDHGWVRKLDDGRDAIWLKRLCDDGQIQDLIEVPLETPNIMIPVRCICDKVLMIKDISTSKLPINLLNDEHDKNTNFFTANYRINNIFFPSDHRDIINSPLTKIKINNWDEGGAVCTLKASDAFELFEIKCREPSFIKGYSESEDVLIIAYEDSTKHQLAFSKITCVEENRYPNSNGRFRTEVFMDSEEIALKITFIPLNFKVFISGNNLIIAANQKDGNYVLVIYSLEESKVIWSQLCQGNFSHAELVDKSLFLIFKTDDGQNEKVEVCFYDLAKYL